MAQLVFNSDTGLVAPETADIRADIVGKIQAAFQTSPSDPVLNCEPSSPMGQVVDLFVAEIEAKNAEIIFLANMINPNTAQGKHLDALAALYGISRKISEPTIVTCQVTGLRGTVVPYGAIAEDENGNQFRCSVSGGVLIGDSGEAEAAFQSIDHGALEVASGSLDKIVTVVAGWDSISNRNPGAVGRNEETDAELRNRMLQSYAINATSFVDAIEANLAELDGVIDVRVLENYTNVKQTKFGLDIDPHSVAVCIVGGDDTEIARTIYERKDAGCGTSGSYPVQFSDAAYSDVTYNYLITRPTSGEFKVKVEFFAAAMAEDAQKAVKEAIVADILGKSTHDRIGIAETVYASRFYSVIQSVTTAPVRLITVALDAGDYGQSVVIPAAIEPTSSIDSVSIALGAGG